MDTEFWISRGAFIGDVSPLWSSSLGGPLETPGRFYEIIDATANAGSKL